MPNYYRLAMEDLDALDRWWNAYSDRIDPSIEDIALKEFFVKKRAELVKLRGSR